MKKWILVGVVSICPMVYAGQIADLHRKMFEGKPSNYAKSREWEEIRSRKHGITEIGLERTRCLGTCPAYTVFIRSNGTLRYQGEGYVKRLGKHTGKVNVGAFHELAQFIKDAGYTRLENRYSCPVDDNPTTYTTVIMNGKRKVIENYANAGPTNLWAIEQLIDKLVLEAQWDDKKPTGRR